MIYQLLVLVLSVNLHAKMVQQSAPEIPEFAPDGTPVAQLVPYEELSAWPVADQRRYLRAIHIALINYEQIMGPHVLDDFIAKHPSELRRLFHSFFGNRAEAAPAGTHGDDSKKKNVDFRCFIAGWPVQKSTCEAPTEASYEIEKGRKIKLRCSSGEIICNPVIFGVKSSLCGTATSSQGPTEPAAKRVPTGADANPIPDDQDLRKKNNTFWIGDVAFKKGGSKTSQTNVQGPKSAAVTTAERSLASPVCIPSSSKKTASAACLQKAKDEKTCLNINGNREEYEQFANGFNAICGTKGVKDNKYYKNRSHAVDDMQKTCEVIRQTLDRGRQAPQMRNNQPGAAPNAPNTMPPPGTGR